MKNKGFAPLPNRYPPKGRWFCSHNWENGLYGTLDECLDRVQHYFVGTELLGEGFFLLSLQEKLDPNNAVHQAVIQAVESRIQQEENRLTRKVRAKIRNTCLQEGGTKGGDYSSQWEIYFKDKRGET